LPVDRVAERRTHPRRRLERTALRAELVVDVLEARARAGLDRDAARLADVRERLLRLRVDRVDLAALDRLDLRVRVRDELEHDLREVRLVRPPVVRVPLDRDLLA